MIFMINLSNQIFTKIPLDKWYLTELLLIQIYRQKFLIINNCYQELLLNQIYRQKFS
jgi:hypothetical protein